MINKKLLQLPHHATPASATPPHHMVSEPRAAQEQHPLPRLYRLYLLKQPHLHQGTRRYRPRRQTSLHHSLKLHPLSQQSNRDRILRQRSSPRTSHPAPHRRVPAGQTCLSVSTCLRARARMRTSSSGRYPVDGFRWMDVRGRTWSRLSRHGETVVHGEVRKSDL